MGMDQIVRIDRLTSDLGVEVKAARREATAPQHFVEHQRKVRHVHCKLVGIPAEQVVAPIDIERTEDAECPREGDLVVERVAGEDSVVLLDVEFDVFEKIVALKEAVAGSDVEIVLVLGRLLGLGLDQERAFLKPILCLCSTTSETKRPSWSSSRFMSVLSRVSYPRARPKSRSSGRPVDASPRAPLAPVRRRKQKLRIRVGRGPAM